MADHALIWRHRDPDHIRFFAGWLKPLMRSAGTAGTRIFDDPSVAAETVQCWILGLADVPGDVLDEARARFLSEGVTWMPQPGHIKRHCVAITQERIQTIAAQARAITEACERCHGSGWTEVELDGYARVARCGCHAEAMALMSGAPKALPIPKDHHDEDSTT